MEWKAWIFVVNLASLLLRTSAGDRGMFAFTLRFKTNGFNPSYSGHDSLSGTYSRARLVVLVSRVVRLVLDLVLQGVQRTVG